LRIVQKISVGELLLYKSDSREPFKKKSDYMPKRMKEKKNSAYVKILCSLES
jgi:hypothetical protein